LSGTLPGRGCCFQPFGFAGGLFDDSTNLVKFGARDNDPSVGRWTAKDPIRFVGGETGLYVYADNDPVGALDPSGLQTWQVGVNFSGSFLGIGWTVSATVAFDYHGNLGILYTGGLGGGVGAKFQGGVSVLTSDATTICDLKRVFETVSVGAGAGLSGAIDTFWGDTQDGFVVGGGFTLGAGLGVGGFVGPTYTGIPGPVLHLW